MQFNEGNSDKKKLLCCLVVIHLDNADSFFTAR